MSPAGREQLRTLRLLFAVPFSPRRDAMHGGRVVAQLLSRLTERHRVALVYLRPAASAPADDELTSRCTLVEEIVIGDRGPAASRWDHRLNVLQSPLTGIPSPVAPVRDHRLARACVDIAKRWEPDIVQVEHDHLAYCGPALERGGSEAIRLLVCHEPGTLASEDQARLARGRQRLSHRLDAASWRRYRARTYPAFDAIVAFTEEDRDAIEAAARGPRYEVIRLGIDIPEERLSATGHGRMSVLFVGGYWHPPNADAARRLMFSIMPEVRERVPGLRLLLVGAHPGRDLSSGATPDDTVTGTVPSVRPFLDQASLVVLPIRTGGGMRVKLLEALAAGKAVIASPLAAAGLDVTDGRELALARTDHEFADAIVALVADADARSRLGHNAREWARRNLTWDARVREYEQLYGSLLASRTS